MRDEPPPQIGDHRTLVDEPFPQQFDLSPFEASSSGGLWGCESVDRPLLEPFGWNRLVDRRDAARPGSIASEPSGLRVAEILPALTSRDSVDF